MYQLFSGNKKGHDNVHDNNAFFVDIMSTLKAIKALKRSYDEQNVTPVVISYEN